MTAPTVRDPALIAVVSVGGALGSLARWLVAQAIPVPSGGFPVATFLTNVGGSFALGVVAAACALVWPHRRLLRPFLGTGVLGGFTTFSTWMLESRNLAANGHLPLALGYVVLSLLTGIPAAWAGLGVTRRLARRPPPPAGRAA